MFQNSFQGGEYVEILTSQSKDALTPWKVSKAIPRTFDKSAKGFTLNMDAGAVKIQLPKDDKKDLALVQPYLVFQMMVPSGKQLSIELSVTDSSQTRRRLMFSTGTKEIVINPLHSRIPINHLKRGVWMNFCIDLVGFVHGLFKGNNYRSLDHITLSNACKLRRIYTLRSALLDLDEAEENDGMIDSSMYATVPKAMEFPPGITYTNQLFTLEKVRQAAPTDQRHDAVAALNSGTKKIGTGTVQGGTGNYQIAFGSRHLNNDTRTTASRRGLASPGFRREKSQGRVLAQTGSSVVGSKKQSVRGSPSVDSSVRDSTSAPVKNFEIGSQDFSESHEEVKDQRTMSSNPPARRSTDKRHSLAVATNKSGQKRSGISRRYNLAGGDDEDILEDSYDFLNKHRSPATKKLQSRSQQKSANSRTERSSGVSNSHHEPVQKSKVKSAREPERDLYNFQHQEDVMGWGGMPNDNFNYADEANFEIEGSGLNQFNTFDNNTNDHATASTSKPGGIMKTSSFEASSMSRDGLSRNSGKSTNASSSSGGSGKKVSRAEATGNVPSSSSNHGSASSVKHKSKMTKSPAIPNRSTAGVGGKPLASTTTIVNSPGKGYHFKESSGEKKPHHGNAQEFRSSYDDEMRKMRTFNNFYVQHDNRSDRVETEEIEENLEFDDSLKIADSGSKLRKSNPGSDQGSPDDHQFYRDSLENSPEKKKFEDLKDDASRSLQKDLDALVDDVRGVGVSENGSPDRDIIKKGRKDDLDVIPLHDFDDDDDAEVMAEKIASAGKRDPNDKDFTFRGSLETEHLLKMNNSRPFTPPFTTVANMGTASKKMEESPNDSDSLTGSRNEGEDKGGMVDLVFDPILKCYYDPKTNEYYEHLEAR